MMDSRTNWTFEEIQDIYNMPLLDLVYRAASVHRQYHNANEIKLNTLISFKTGDCSQDCAYCAQSSRYNTHVEAHEMFEVDQVLALAREAKENNVPRVCLSASWRFVPSNNRFDKVLDMISSIKEIGLDVCCTLGTLSHEQAVKLKEAGISAYNHNIDTSEEFYKEIVTTRTFQDRIDTLKLLQEVEIPYCSGGIIGLGESHEDRMNMLKTLATQEVHPYNLPINSLIPIKGTPLEDRPIVDPLEVVRVIAVARILMPTTNVSLAAGRIHMTHEAQALCFLAGANTMFLGQKLLTTENPEADTDRMMLQKLGLHGNKLKVGVN